MILVCRIDFLIRYFDDNARTLIVRNLVRLATSPSQDSLELSLPGGQG